MVWMRLAPCLVLLASPLPAFAQDDVDDEEAFEEESVDEPEEMVVEIQEIE